MMRASHERRLQALEATAIPLEPLRILIQFINPDKTLSSLYADGRHFKRLPGEPDEAFEARVRVELGWRE